MTIANQGIPEVKVLTNIKDQTETGLILFCCVGWLSRDDLTMWKGHAGPLNIYAPNARKTYFLILNHTSDSNWHQTIQQV